MGGQAEQCDQHASRTLSMSCVMRVTCPLPSSPVGHANEQDVIEGIHAIDLGEQLIDDGVVHAAAAGHAAALLADGVDLVKDDDVQLGAVALLRLLCLRILQAHGYTGTGMMDAKCACYACLRKVMT